MFIIKRFIKIVFFISLFLLFIPSIKEKIIEKKVEYIINNKSEEEIYEGYIYIPKFDYKNIIKKDISALDENYVVMMDYSDQIDGNSIVLAGHNNRYVFNKLYYLDIGDEVILNDFNIEYKYKVIDMKYIEVDNFKELEIDNALILITCSYDNQKRYIVILNKE